MTQLVTTFSTTFSNSPLTEDDLVQVPFEGGHFGILNLAVPSAPCTDAPQEIVCVCDESGSMEYKCPDGGTKMQHTIHTLKNIARFIIPFDNVYLSVYAFNHKFRTVLERTKITEDNLLCVNATLDKIYPTGSTDIENALLKTSQAIDAILDAHPTHTVHNLFMTDGDATAGSKDKDVLKNLVNPNIYNSFIGFGMDHDSYLLNYLCGFHNKKSNYYFIEAIEKAGMVYGEILHGILYKLFTDVQIEISNGLIYDFTSNTWGKSLFIGDIVGEANKNYHLISDTPDHCAVYFDGEHLGGVPIHLAAETPSVVESSELKKFIFRQRTLQFLFEAQKIQSKQYNKKVNKNMNNYSWFVNVSEEVKKERQKLFEENTEMKHKLRGFFDEIKKYMEDNLLTEDKFLKNLCDDIYISYQTFGTRLGTMFTCSRQTSQGTQRCYAVCQIPDLNDLEDNNTIFAPHAPRHYNYNLNLNIHSNINSFAHDDGLEHCVSDHTDTPYTTPSAARIMAEISCGSVDDDELEQIV